jgi:hypothetical protein
MEVPPNVIVEKLNAQTAEPESKDTLAATPTPPTETPAATNDLNLDDMRKRIVNLSKRDKELLAREKKAKEIEEKYGKYADVDKLFSTAKTDSAAFDEIINRSGLTVDEIVQHFLKKDKPTGPEDKVLSIEEKLNRLEEERRLEKEDAEKAKTAKEETEKQARLNEEVSLFKKTISARIDTDPDKYELIKTMGAEAEVFESVVLAIKEAVSKDPEAYPTRESVEESLLPKIMDLVEEELSKDITSKFEKLRMAKKTQGLFGARVAEKSAPKDIPVRTPTLTNKMTAASSAPGKRLLSKEESLREIAKKYQF